MPPRQSKAQGRSRGRGGGGGSGSGGVLSQEDIEGQLSDLGFSGDTDDIFFGGVAADTPVRHNFLPGGGQSESVQGRPAETGLTDVGTVLRAFYRLEQDQLRRFQVLMFAGGFYGATNIEDVQWGSYDDASFSAWAAATEQAARRLDSGEEITVSQVVNEGALMSGMQLEDGQVPTPDQLANQLEELDPEEPDPGEMVQRQGDLISILLSDPNELRVTMDNVASATLGRKANPGEQQMLIGFIHELQRKGQTAQQTAEPGEVWAHISAEELEAAAMDPATAMGLDDSIPEPEDVTVEYAAPNPQAAAESLLRQENPAEAGAHDISMQFANFMEFLGGTGSGFPRQTYGGGGF